MRILVTDGHYKHALGAVRLLADAGHDVIVSAPRRLAMARVSRAAWLGVTGPASSDTQRFLAHLDAVVQRHRPSMIMPVGAAACGLLSEHRDRWPGTAIVLPDPITMRRA